MNSPLCRRVPSIGRASSSSAGSATLCGQPSALGSFIGPSSSADTASSTMKFISKVVTTSSTPSRTFSSTGPSSSAAPASAAAISISVNTSQLDDHKPLSLNKLPTATAANAPP